MISRSTTLCLAVALLGLSACGGGLTPLPPSTAPLPAGDTPRRVRDRPASSGPLGDGVRDIDLDALWQRELMVPVQGLSPSELRNDYEARRGTRAHLALDILAPRGTPVLAADDGTVGRLGATPVGGNIIYAMDPQQRFVYYYAHLDRYARGLSVGDKVSKGDVIGYVGTTGNAPANAPHLHFQVMLRGSGRAWWDGPAINPWPFFVHSGTANR